MTVNKIKYLCIFTFIIILIYSCEKNPDKDIVIIPNKLQHSIKDTVIEFKLNIQDTSIINTSNKEIDVLLNSSKKYLSGTNIEILHFQTECLKCSSIEKFGENILFAKQLLISEDRINYYSKPIKTSGKLELIRSKSLTEHKTEKFKFKEGNGLIKFEKVSCNDTDLAEIQLNYKVGNIIIKNFINATFFEYDLDKNGINEQYLLGTRNCSQEIIILRILNKKI